MIQENSLEEEREIRIGDKVIVYLHGTHGKHEYARGTVSRISPYDETPYPIRVELSGETKYKSGVYRRTEVELDPVMLTKLAELL